jgi:nifR3 family TIM-barrel protein
MIRPFRIGAVALNCPVLVAPMAGVTDAPFRKQAARFGAPYTVCEMIAGEQLAKARPDEMRRAAPAAGTPFVMQLAGREERWMAAGAALATDAGADVIDINMGCPAKKVTTGLSGAALMREPERAERLITAVLRNTDRPVTLKMRLGWDETHLNAADIAQRAAALGIAMIVVHGRTRQQFYTGVADWSAIRTVVDAVQIPVIANGDIACRRTADTALSNSGAAGVMIGRASNGRPWLAGALVRAFTQGGPLLEPPTNAIEDSLLELIEDSWSLYGLALGGRVARKHIAWTIDACADRLPEAHRRVARAEICRLDCADAVVSAIRRLFAEMQPTAYQERAA